MVDPIDSSAVWEFWHAVRKAAAILEREAEAALAAELHISFGQFMVLSVIDAHPGPLNQTAIANHLGLTKGTVSRLIEQGVQSGWIKVSPDPVSRRSRLISLTAEGAHLVQRGDAILEHSPLARISTMDPTVAQATTAALQGVINVVQSSQGAGQQDLPPAVHPMGHTTAIT